MEQTDRMLLNSAIERLISSSGSDEDAAAIVIACTKDLPILGIDELNITRYSDGKTFSAHTAEMGDIPIDTGGEARTKKIMGGEAERIGNYRIKKEKNGRISISHFWGYEMTTRMPDEVPQKFVIFYGKQNYEYLRFFIVVPTLRTIKFFSYRFNFVFETLSELYVVKK